MVERALALCFLDKVNFASMKERVRTMAGLGYFWGLWLVSLGA